MERGIWLCDWRQCQVVVIMMMLVGNDDEIPVLVGGVE